MTNQQEEKFVDIELSKLPLQDNKELDVSCLFYMFRKFNLYYSKIFF